MGIKETLNKYKYVGKFSDKVPVCELCRTRLIQDKEWVCPNCGLVQGPILRQEMENPYKHTNETLSRKFQRERNFDVAFNRKMRLKLMNQGYAKKRYETISNVGCQKDVQQRFAHYCERWGFKQWETCSIILSAALDILERQGMGAGNYRKKKEKK